MFRDVHVKKSTKFTGKDIPELDSGPGANDINPTKQESRFVRCQWCSSINDTFLRPKGDGWSGNISTTSISGTNQLQPVVDGAGCWFCGSSNYY